MSKDRARIFGNDETPTLDVGAFAPKIKSDPKAPPADQVRALSQAAKFPSRESTPAKQEKTKATKREPRRYRTGRNVQISIKALAESVERFYAITDAQKGWVLGYTFQRAVEALDRELKQPQ